MLKCSGYWELQIDFTQEICDKNVIKSLKSTSNSISSSSEIVPSSLSSSSPLSLSTVCWFSGSSSSTVSFAAFVFFGGQNHVSAGSSNPYTTVWKTEMFKTVLQQHSFRETVKFLNALNTAHHTKSKDQYFARNVWKTCYHLFWYWMGLSL